MVLPLEMKTAPASDINNAQNLDQNRQCPTTGLKFFKGGLLTLVMEYQVFGGLLQDSMGLLFSINGRKSL